MAQAIENVFPLDRKTIMDNEREMLLIYADKINKMNPDHFIGFYLEPVKGSYHDDPLDLDWESCYPK